MSELKEYPELKDFSPQLQRAIMKRIADQKKFHAGMPFVFKLIGTGQLDKSTSPPTMIGIDSTLPTGFRVYDPYDKKRQVKIIRNITGYSPSEQMGPDGNMRYVDVPQYGKMEFIRGYHSVTTEEPLKLGMFMYADNCTTKPNFLKRAHDVSALYWEEDNASLYIKDYREETNEFKLLSLAMQSATRSSLDNMKVVLYSVAEKNGSSVPTFGSADSIEHDFYQYVSKNPREYININIDPKVKAGMTVMDAMARQFLVNNVKDSKFELVFAKNRALIYAYKVTEQEDPQRSLVDFLVSEKGEEKLEMIKKYMKPRAHPYLPEEETEQGKEPIKEKELELA
jgi:hypothetical protein